MPLKSVKLVIEYLSTSHESFNTILKRLNAISESEHDLK